MQDLKILALQSDLFWENPEANRKHFAEQIDHNFNAHHLILLPETFTTGFPVSPIHFAETTEGATIQWMKAIAEKTGAVIAGTLLLANSRGFANTLVWMSPDGSFERYEKRHVFSMGGEDEHITAGEAPLLVNLHGWRIKPMICYDLRFPVWSKNRLLNNRYEYDLAIYLANWPAVRSYPWRQLLIARAIENQAYVIGVNRVGKDDFDIDYQGDSMFVDSKGQILTEGMKDHASALSASLSAKELLSFREKFNVGLDWDNFEIQI